MGSKVDGGSSGGTRQQAFRVGDRLLHVKSRQPITLRYIGPLPSSKTEVWYGVEYDDPSKGKGHSGSYEGLQIFQTRQTGAGAFVKFGRSPAFELGKTFLQALEERYGPLVPHNSEASSSPSSSSTTESLVLGSSKSNIVVEVPNIREVQQRLGRLEKLREMGLEGEWVNGLGADSDTRQIIRDRLKGLQMLNLSRNLLTSWEAVAQIVDCLRGLRTLVLNDSCIAPLPPEVPPNTAARLMAAFGNITELHLGSACIAWQEIRDLAAFFPNLDALYLNDNALIRDLRMTPNSGADQDFAKLRKLSLRGCQIVSWEDVVHGLGQYHSLESLDLSSLPMASIPSPGNRQHVQASLFIGLTSLILLESCISRWSDIGALDLWTSGRLLSLRMSFVEQEDCSSLSDFNHLSGDPAVERLIIIAKLTSLQSLNSTPITQSERRDAESFYISHVAKLLVAHSDTKPSDWGRYELLCAKHGRPITSSIEVRSTALRSKMISLHVYLAQHTPFEVTILPSAPTSLLQRRIAKQAGLRDAKAVRIWTTRRAGQQREKVLDITDENGTEIGWWLSDGEELIAETP